jgi:hypothetical protein
MAPTLRQRNAKIAPVNGYSFKRGKKVENLSAVKKKTIDKKKKKLVKISDDVLFDMLRLFTRRELHAFKLVNRRMKRVVELGDQKKQLRQQFVLAKIDFSVWIFIFFCRLDAVLVMANCSHKKCSNNQSQ